MNWGFIFQKTTFFIDTAVIISDVTQTEVRLRFQINYCLNLQNKSTCQYIFKEILPIEVHNTTHGVTSWNIGCFTRSIVDIWSVYIFQVWGKFPEVLQASALLFAFVVQLTLCCLLGDQLKCQVSCCQHFARSSTFADRAYRHSTFRNMLTWTVAVSFNHFLSLPRYQLLSDFLTKILNTSFGADPV
jgi:hypothetical protein